ncbi:hypothetical protein IU487_32975 [Nocardia puris]|uniref:hypothetical protein n=1 Tax=Nocardia puris TaxID=208602 RepID=UPI001894D49A|nr:hypothetical protein [Nocardia puris]MBF6215814.1 hypothetical protein [Nocardia puris]
MLQIRLGKGQAAPKGDPLGRRRLGYWDDMSEQEVWETGRGVWKLKADRVLEHDEVQIVDLDGIVRAVARITGISKHDDRRAIEGELLLGDPRIGQPTTTPHPSLNSVAYFD